MAVANHAFQSTIGDDTPTYNAGGVTPSRWNAAHPITYTVKVKSTDYTLVTDANGVVTDDVVHCSGTMNLTIPAATGSGKPVMIIADSGTVAVTVLRTGSDTIGLGTDFIVTTPGDNFVITDEATGLWSLSYTPISSLREGCTSTATANSTTTLTATSKYCQIFTGTASQTCKLPAVSAFPLGGSFQVINASTGIITITSSGDNTIVTLKNGESVVCTSNAITGTDATVWVAPLSPKTIRAVLGSNFTTNVTNANQAVTGLPLPVGNSETWEFEYRFSMGNSASTGCRPSIMVSAGSPTIQCQVFGSTTRATAFIADRLSATNTIATGTTYTATTTTNAILKITGIISTTTGGACTVYPGLRAGNAAATVTAYANSCLIATRV